MFTHYRNGRRSNVIKISKMFDHFRAFTICRVFRLATRIICNFCQETFTNVTRNVKITPPKQHRSDSPAAKQRLLSRLVTPFLKSFFENLCILYIYMEIGNVEIHVRKQTAPEMCYRHKPSSLYTTRIRYGT